MGFQMLNDYSLLPLDEAREKSLQADNGRHAKLATDYRGIVFAWSRVQKPGYEPRHAGPPKNYSIVYSEEHGGFAMVVPAGMYQPVTVGPHTNYGQPCGGYGCDGRDPMCDDCNLVAYEAYRDQWRGYYAGITPLTDYGSRYGDDHY